MGKVLWHRSMSLDGFIAGPNHEMDWMGDSSHDADLVNEVIATTGAILSGRRAYDWGAKLFPGETAKQAYGGAWSGPVFVLTHHPEDAVPEEGLTFLDCTFEEAIRIGLEAANGKNLEIFGGDIASQAALKGLVDELIIHLMPVMIGTGVRLFESEELVRIPWERIGIYASQDQVVSLRYRPVALAP